LGGNAQIDDVMKIHARFTPGLVLSIFTLTIGGCFSMSQSDDTPPPQALAPVARTSLLTAVIEGAKTVERVEVKRIDMPPNLPSGLHLHPCPVVGVITEGSILFQVEGQPARVLKPGDAFFEPANTRVPHFDAQEQGASFVAYYLLGANETELIKMLE
jgi:quercetin dioxygenase-like cupin family protein